MSSWSCDYEAGMTIKKMELKGQQQNTSSIHP